MGSILVLVPNSKQGYNFGQKWAELPDLKVGMNKSGQKHFFIFQILRMYIMLCQHFCFISLSFFSTYQFPSGRFASYKLSLVEFYSNKVLF